MNWYLVADEAHNEDGRHTGYLHDLKFVGCDDELLGKLGCMVYGNQRNVQTLQQFELIPYADYYCEELIPPVGNRDTFRSAWHQNAKSALQRADIIFLDPDNELLPKRVSPNSTKRVKYILQQEIMDYYVAGHSVVFYNHRWRMDEECYLKQFLAFFQSPSFHGAHIIGLKYVRGTVRDYFFLIQSLHLEQVEGAIETMLSGRWSHHFKRLPIMSSELSEQRHKKGNRNAEARLPLVG